MPLPLPIFQPDAVPKDYVSQYFENMFFEQAVIEDIDKDKIISILDLLDILIPIKHNPAKKHEYFSITQTTKKGVDYVAFEINIEKWKGLFGKIRHLIPRKINAPDFGHIEIELLHQLERKDLETIISGAEINIQEIKPNEFLLLKQECDNNIVIGIYQAGDVNILELNVISTHIHNPQYGFLSIENFLKIKKMLGEKQFYRSLGEDWHTIDKLPIISRELLRKLDSYIKSRIPDIYSFLTYPFESLNKCAESISMQSLIDTLLLAKRKRKHLKKIIVKSKERINDVDYNVLEVNLWDVSVSTNRVRYLWPEDHKNQGYVEINLGRRLRERTLYDIISRIPGAGIRRFNNSVSRGFEFIDTGRETTLGRYILGYCPRNADDLQDPSDDRIELRIAKEKYFSSEAYKHSGYLNKKAHKSLIKMCGSERIFEVLFGSDWKPDVFSVLPTTSKEIIQAIDYHIRQRTFKWLDRYNQGGAASGTMTLVRGR